MANSLESSMRQISGHLPRTLTRTPEAGANDEEQSGNNHQQRTPVETVMGEFAFDVLFAANTRRFRGEPDKRANTQASPDVLQQELSELLESYRGADLLHGGWTDNGDHHGIRVGSF